MLIIEWCLIQLSRNEAALGSRGVSHTFDPRELGTDMQVISKRKLRLLGVLLDAVPESEKIEF